LAALPSAEAFDIIRKRAAQIGLDQEQINHFFLQGILAYRFSGAGHPRSSGLCLRHYQETGEDLLRTAVLRSLADTKRLTVSPLDGISPDLEKSCHTLKFHAPPPTSFTFT